MIPQTLAQIAKTVSGEIVNDREGLVINGVEIDTRKLKDNNLFIPLKGEKTDGHNYVTKAIAQGASASLWERHKTEQPSNIPLIIVDNCLETLHKLAKYFLSIIKPIVIGITGSNGKTTTKDLVASVLGKSFIVHKTSGNYNNHIGLPLTILNAPVNSQILVLEMGMSQLGEIAFLSNLANPKYAIITNIGEAHMHELHSKVNIAKAKCEITSGLAKDGIVFYNGDEQLLQNMLLTCTNKCTFGLSSKNDYHPNNIQNTILGVTFVVNEVQCELSYAGTHNVSNALAAIALAQVLNVSWSNIRAGLKQARLTNMRMELLMAKNGAYILNDAYNANPTSMKAALSLIHELKGFSKKKVVLADMFGLGTDEIKWHENIGFFIDATEIDTVYTLGEKSYHIARAAQNNFRNGQVYHFYDKRSLIAELKKTLLTNEVILFKGSRGMMLEKIISTLVDV